MVLVTFGSSVFDAKIMLGMLVKVLRGDSIATRRRLPREGDVTFEDLMSATSNFDVRTVTIEGLTSVRYLLPITVSIITVMAAMRSASLSWSHRRPSHMVMWSKTAIGRERMPRELRQEPRDEDRRDGPVLHCTPSIIPA